MSDDTFRGCVALVTGAGHGIGRAISAAFAVQGAAVAVVDRDVSRAEEVVAELRGRFSTPALPLHCDVSDSAAVTAMVRAGGAELGRIDVLVNNAGIYPNTPVLDMGEAEWDAVFDVNVKGMFLVSQAVARQMIARGDGWPDRQHLLRRGRSRAALGAAHYCSSKAAVNMLTRVLAIELAPHGIIVNAVSPGLIEVPDWSLREEYVDALVGATPLGRIGQPEDIARAVLYLASPQATFITGTVLSVDGGSWPGGRCR